MPDTRDDWALESEHDRPERRFWLHEGRFVVEFKYDEALVQALRELPVRGFDPAHKRWIVPPTPQATAPLVPLVERYRFHASPEDLDELFRIANLFHRIRDDHRLDAVQRYIYRAPDYGTLVSIPWPPDPAVFEEVKTSMSGIWDSRIYAFRIDPAARDADYVLSIAHEYDFYVEPSEYERLRSEGDLLFRDDEFTYDPLSSPDRVMYRMLIRLSKSRREALFDAVRNYRYP